MLLSQIKMMKYHFFVINLDDEHCGTTMMKVATSQRAIVVLKSILKLNKTAVAWYLSSGCQGPFISWDQEVIQAIPNLEYKLDVANWSFDSIQKQGMSLLLSDSIKLSEHLKIYEKQVAKSLKQVINEYTTDQVLLPLSGGLDSRLLLALSKRTTLADKLMLVNWGGSSEGKKLDDTAAAERVANSYKKELLVMFCLPEFTTMIRYLIALQRQVKDVLIISMHLQIVSICGVIFSSAAIE